MTAPACRRAPSLSGALLLAAVAWMGVSGSGRAAGVQWSAEWIVVDPNSGLAISGFDPVAYFTEGAARQGKGEFEQVFAGTVWRFLSAGNRAAFMADPDIYMPRFGGYDPVGIARGTPVAGNPRLWLLRTQRLYLFYTPATREEFRDQGERVVATADSVWPRIQLRSDP